MTDTPASRQTSHVSPCFVVPFWTCTTSWYSGILTQLKFRPLTQKIFAFFFYTKTNRQLLLPTDELTVDQPYAILKAPTVWGALHGEIISLHPWWHCTLGKKRTLFFVWQFLFVCLFIWNKTMGYTYTQDFIFHMDNYSKMPPKSASVQTLKMIKVCTVNVLYQSDVQWKHTNTLLSCYECAEVCAPVIYTPFTLVLGNANQNKTISVFEILILINGAIKSIVFIFYFVGLETFSQLVYEDEYGAVSGNSVVQDPNFSAVL